MLSLENRKWFCISYCRLIVILL